MSGRLGRRRGQMKGIGVAGGGGPPRPPQPPSRPWPRRFVGEPRAVQTPPRFLFPQPPGTRRASARSSDLGVAGGEWAARSPRGSAGFPSGQRLGHPLWAPGWGGRSSPGVAPGKCPGSRAKGARAGGCGRARSCPAAGVPLPAARLPPRPGGPPRWHPASEGNSSTELSVCLGLEKGGGGPFSGGRGCSLLRVDFAEEGRRRLFFRCHSPKTDFVHLMSPVSISVLRGGEAALGCGTSGPWVRDCAPRKRFLLAGDRGPRVHLPP